MQPLKTHIVCPDKKWKMFVLRKILYFVPLSEAQRAEAILNKISNNINKTLTGLINVLQGFHKCTVQATSVLPKAYVWYEIRVLWVKINHNKSHAMTLAFILLTDINQIF